MLDDSTPMILTYNEESNIRRTLEPLRWVLYRAMLRRGRRAWLVAYNGPLLVHVTP